MLLLAFLAPPNSCFFGLPISANLAEIGKPFYFFDFPISANVAEIGKPFVCFEKVGVVVPLVGESCNWYCRSVLCRFNRAASLNWRWGWKYAVKPRCQI